MKSVAIFGTGSALKDFLSILPADVAVIGLGDNDIARHGQRVEGHLIHPAADFSKLDCTRFVIAGRAVDTIRTQLEQLGVASTKISAYYPSYSDKLGSQINHDIATLNADLGLGLPASGLATMYLWPDNAPGADEIATDFVRRQSFRLAAEQINRLGIPGSIAELGVYQGEQAALLNRLFPSRALLLFDTFQGFFEKDLSAEQNSGFSNAVLGDFQDTSTKLVLAKMETRENVIIHQGFFPDTAKGVDDNFAFVSLDVDLHDPTLAGLEFFYPRLSKGGFIFVHDYNNRRYMGVRKAVDFFLSKSGAAALPLPDFAGSIVVMK